MDFFLWTPRSDRSQSEATPLKTTVFPSRVAEADGEPNVLLANDVLELSS